jgi:glycolate oxidase FAD binding subunit
MPALAIPESEEALAEIIATTGPFSVQGSGSKKGYGRHAPQIHTLSLATFSGVEIYEPEELILEAGAATPLAHVRNLIAQRNQMLAFEPPDHAHLWGGSGGSLGGLVSTGLAGPRRIKAGSVRDHILGVRGVTGRGEIFSAGARVVKNVTGYDMPKLMTGACGTLAALTRVTLKVLPAPETEETVVVRGLDAATAIDVMAEALQSSGEISGAAHVPDVGTCLRFEGVAVSVAARRDRHVSQLKHGCELLDDASSKALWAQIRDCKVLTLDRSHALWRISVPPSEGARVALAIASQLDAQYFMDWGGGLLWVRVVTGADAQAQIVRAAVTQGHATLYVAPDHMRAEVPIFQPQEAANAALTARLKKAFDPHGKLNPGRMYEGL